MKRNDTLRIYFFLGAVTLLFGLIGYKLFLLSYVKHDYYAKTAQQQTDHINNLISRGNIYFTDKLGAQAVAATNKKFSVVAILGTEIDQAAVDQSRCPGWPPRRISY